MEVLRATDAAVDQDEDTGKRLDVACATQPTEFINAHSLGDFRSADFGMTRCALHPPPAGCYQSQNEQR